MLEIHKRTLPNLKIIERSEPTYEVFIDRHDDGVDFIGVVVLNDEQAFFEPVINDLRNLLVYLKISSFNTNEFVYCHNKNENLYNISEDLIESHLKTNEVLQGYDIRIIHRTDNIHFQRFWTPEVPSAHARRLFQKAIGIQRAARHFNSVNLLGRPEVEVPPWRKTERLSFVLESGSFDDLKNAIMSHPEGIEHGVLTDLLDINYLAGIELVVDKFGNDATMEQLYTSRDLQEHDECRAVLEKRIRQRIADSAGDTFNTRIPASSRPRSM